MANTLKLEIVTPSAVVYSEDVSLVALPGRQGDMGIYPNHVPLMTKVAAGEVEVTRDGQKEMLCLLYTSPSPRDATLSRMPSSA